MIIRQQHATEFLLYSTPDGEIKVEVFLHDENLRLTQEQIAQLFGVKRPAITKHIKNIFLDEELEEKAVSSILEHTASDGKLYKTKFYNLDLIIAVGYRVNSKQATKFRIWATKILKEYMIKGFSMDDSRLQNGMYFGKDYFQELLERIRSIRMSERRIWQKITDIFAECSIDYDKNTETAQNFYAMIQNKFHFAIVGKTAAEIIYGNVDNSKPFMGLKTWRNAVQGRILRSDTIVAKNYLDEQSIKKLERTISGYFDYLERVIETREALTMESLDNSINQFLQFNKYEILKNKGNISHEQAKQKAFTEYEIFNKTQCIESDFDREVQKLLKRNDLGG